MSFARYAITSIKTGLDQFLNWFDEWLRPIPYSAFEYQVTSNGTEEFCVVIRNLKVWLYPKDDYWVAQGLDIGYVAAAKTRDDARKRFERGLGSSICLNLEKFGTLEHLVRPAAPVVWRQWRKAVHQAIREHKEKRPSVTTVELKRRLSKKWP